MSVYYVNKVMYMIENDSDFLEKMRTDVDTALKGFRLTEDEKAAIKRGEVAALYRMGTHAFLLNGLARHSLCGVNRENYMERIRTVTSKQPGKKGDPRKE
jgi:hypothetical protein